MSTPPPTSASSSSTRSVSTRAGRSTSRTPSATSTPTTKRRTTRRAFSTGISFRIKSQASRPRKTPRHDTDLLRLLRPGQHRGGGAGGVNKKPCALRHRPTRAPRAHSGALRAAARRVPGGRADHHLRRRHPDPVSVRPHAAQPQDRGVVLPSPARLVHRGRRRVDRRAPAGAAGLPLQWDEGPGDDQGRRSGGQQHGDRNFNVQRLPVAVRDRRRVPAGGHRRGHRPGEDAARGGRPCRGTLDVNRYTLNGQGETVNRETLYVKRFAKAWATCRSFFVVTFNG